MISTLDSYKFMKDEGVFWGYIALFDPKSMLMKNAYGESKEEAKTDKKRLSAKEEFATYKAHFRAKNTDIGVDNTYFWNINFE